MFHWGFLLGAALLAVSVMRLLPDRAGYWLDLALVMFALYLGGCTIGSLLRGLVVARGMRPSP